MAPGATAIRPNPLGSALMSEGVAGLRRVLTEEPALLDNRAAREDLADTFLLLKVGLGREGSGDHARILQSLRDDLLDLSDSTPADIQALLNHLEGVPVASATERVLGLTRFGDPAQTSAQVGAVLRGRLFAGQTTNPLLVMVGEFVEGTTPRVGSMLKEIVDAPRFDSLFDREIVQEMWSALQELNRELEGPVSEARPHGFEARQARAAALREMLGILIRRQPSNPRIPEDLRNAFFPQ